MTPMTKDSRCALPLCKFLVAVPLLISFLAGCDQESGIHWDFSMPWGPNEYPTLNHRRFAEEVYKATDGELTIHVHPGAVLGIKGPDTLRALEEGIVDMADAASFQQVGSEPILGLESLPYLVDTIDELKLLYTFIRPAVEEAFERHNVKVLIIAPWPNQNFFLPARVETVKDFAGLKMRSYDKLSTDLVARLGMTPIQMPSPDVVPALASGAIDAVMTSTTTGVAQKYWEFLKVTFRSNHTWSNNIAAVNLDSWNKLKPEHRASIERIANELEPQFWEMARSDDMVQLKVLEESGLKTQEPSPELLAAMRAAAYPIWEDFMERVPGSRAFIEQFLTSADKDALG